MITVDDTSPNRCAIVTGGARNIGQAIATRLQADGWRVFVLDTEVPEDVSLRSDATKIDLSDTAATRNEVSRIADRHGLGALVNNVGIVKPALLEDVDLDDFDRLFHLNLRSSIVAARAALPALKRYGNGRIVFNTSRVVLGKKARTLYAATKGAAEAMARGWALELAPARITVNCVAPGPIGTTAFWENNRPEAPQTRDMIEGIPIGRMGTPEDVANAVSFFCDDRTSFVTGQTLFVCGGVTI
ncbi:SDR family NAD(P)-dependent oxidoreductase [Notoacmeibacter ruber]|uniref:SDR family oxidoreductase n=1 Tax=Notoacmeibacter ruber TaxID=2670375 RepID=A0A3L7J8L3_9HYPH|nr:SDR family oxidoreductase [Notoacmeibacter ruber]RLQ86829.1 SDR family oxidoreductase [Notoacmeibacter ruber]